MKKVVVGIVLVLGIGALAVLLYKQDDSLSEMPFIIENVVVHDNDVALGDGDPQTEDAEALFRVTWNAQVREGVEVHNTFLSFKMVNAEDEVLVEHFYDNPSVTDEEQVFSMSQLCSVVPTESCIPDALFVPREMYRLKVYGSWCQDESLNPAYCGDEDRVYIGPVYSNNFMVTE